MPNPYSYDFRQKVIEAIELNGLKKSEASELFNISRNTIDLWLKRKAETGTLQASANQPPGHNIKSPTGKSFAHELRCMGIRLKPRWLNCGRARLVHALSPVRCTKSGSREKKDLWLPGTGRVQTASICCSDSPT